MLFFTYKCFFLSQTELIEGKSTTPCLNRYLTLEKVLDMNMIFIPVVSGNHWSLVVVKIASRKIYMLDSYPGVHGPEMKDGLVNNLVRYLRKMGIDISGYEREVLNVAHQRNTLVDDTYVFI